MGYLSNIKKQYCIAFLHALIPAYVIERLFWQQRGMSVQMVVYTEIVYAATVVLLELPSGILADRFGRKKLLLLCNALAAVELIILLFAHSFLQFALAVFVAGIGKSFSSGSENALLYDSLQTAGQQDNFEKILGRMSAFDFTGSMIAALSGGLLASLFGFEFNYILSIISTITAFAVTLTLKEPPMLTISSGEHSGIRQYAGQALSIFRKQPFVFVYCLTGAVMGSCMSYLDEFWQIILDDIGMPVLFFGVVSAASLSIRIPGNLFAHKLKERFSYNTMLTGIILLSAAGYAAIFLARNLWCLIPMMLVCALAGITDPLVAGYLHHHTQSHIRATTESILSLGLRCMSILIGLIFGYISSSFSIFAGVALLGAICIGFFLFFFGWHRHARMGG